VSLIKINVCKTAESFNIKEWLRSYNQLHENLKINCLPPKNLPSPVLLDIYWRYLWKEEKNINKEFLNPQNLHIKMLGRVWEYIQIVYSISITLNNNLKEKTILSIGAGVEPCLFLFDKLGAKVTASDQYNLETYWFRNHLKYLNKERSIFSHYQNHTPRIEFKNLDLRSNKSLKSLKKYDVIYSVSSLEHIYSTFNKKIKMFKSIIKHLNADGIFSFTTELIVKFKPLRRWRIYLHNIKKQFRFLVKNNFKIGRLLFQLKKKLALNEIKKIIFKISRVYRFNRRYDFYTPEELLKIIKILMKKGIFLVEKVDWDTCCEYPIKSNKFVGQFHSSVSLTFSKNNKFKKIST
jgi:SAM-dependent methyltransferase